MTGFADRPLLHGLLLGVGMPSLALVVLLIAGDLRAWLVQGAVYGLMPVFAVTGLPSYFLTRRLKPMYTRRGVRALGLTHGLGLGGWLVGVGLMWSASPGAETPARLLSAVTGAVMLVAFWPWAGSILAHYEPRNESGAAEQTQDLSSPPR